MVRNPQLLYYSNPTWVYKVMSSLGCLNFVLVNFTVPSILQCFLIVRSTSRPFSRIRTDQLDLVCTKVSTKLVAGIVINITLVRPCSVFAKFRFLLKFSLLLLL